MSECKAVHDAVSSMDSAEMAAGSWADNLIISMILAALDSKFPGVRDFTLKYADLIPFTKIWAAVQVAMLDWQTGKDFISILQDILNSWLTSEQVRALEGK